MIVRIGSAEVVCDTPEQAVAVVKAWAGCIEPPSPLDSIYNIKRECESPTERACRLDKMNHDALARSAEAERHSRSCMKVPDESGPLGRREP